MKTRILEPPSVSHSLRAHANTRPASFCPATSTGREPSPPLLRISHPRRLPIRTREVGKWRLCTGLETDGNPRTVRGSAERGTEIMLGAVMPTESAQAPPGEIEQIFRDHHGMVFRAAYRITGNSS